MAEATAVACCPVKAQWDKEKFSKERAMLVLPRVLQVAKAATVARCPVKPRWVKEK